MDDITNEFDYFVGAVQMGEERLKIYHIAGYTVPITEWMIEDLKNELIEDDEFGLDEEMVNTFQFVIMTKYEVECIMNQYDLPKTLLNKIKKHKDDSEQIIK